MNRQSVRLKLSTYLDNYCAIKFNTLSNKAKAKAYFKKIQTLRFRLFQIPSKFNNICVLLTYF